jgi:acyl-coenzyme A synthetase/AMP-(fatty) acid ligase
MAYSGLAPRPRIGAADDAGGDILNIAEPIALNAQYIPDRVAIERAGEAITYRAFDLLVRRIAARLTAAGVALGDTVGVMLRDTPLHVAAQVAVARRGAVALSLDWRWAAPEIRRLTAQLSPRAVIVEEDLAVRIEGTVVLLEDLEATPPDDAPPVALSHAPLFYAASSGTTGEPKVAVITHEGMFGRMIPQWTNYQLLREDRHLFALPLAYGAGRLAALSHLCLGATLIFYSTIYEPDEIVRVVNETRATTVQIVPANTRAILRQPERPGHLMPAVRLYMSATSGLHPEERRAIRSRIAPNLVDIYASISAGIITFNRNAEQDEAPEAVGRPAFGSEVEIVDEDGRRLPTGAVGLVRVRGPGCAAGFLEDPVSGTERFVDGWCYPGDYGAFDDRGFLRLAGRTADIIKRSGQTIYAGEVERVLAAHPAVSDAAVVGAKSDESDQEVVAFVVLRAPVDTRALIVHCRREIAPYKVPRRIIVVETLPRNASGKVVKAKLLETLV